MKHIATALRRLAIVVTFLLLPGAAAAGDFANEILANSDVISLAKAGVGEDIIVAKIRSTPNVFDLSARALVTLKDNGVSDEIIRAMNASAQRSPAGGGRDDDRFRSELENIASGVNEAKSAGFAWMIANREAAIPSLRLSLASSRPEFRAAAVAAIARVGDRESLPAIRNMLTDSSPPVRRNVAEALVAMNDVSAINSAEQAIARQLSPLDGYIRLAGHARLTGTAAALGRVLESSPEPANRAAAAWALGEIGRAGTAGRPALERALEADSEASVRREAAAAIAKFHDSRSAQLLQDACARDPQVRKVTLAAMADYPETVEFLIGVMGLGAEQIAGDELETARTSLVRLTGRDFGMDSGRWSEWFEQNRGSFAGVFAAPPPATPTQEPAGLPARPPEVDVETWGIVADSSGIPMAPQVDEGRRQGPPSSAGGLPLPPPDSFGASLPSSDGFGPSAPSSGGFGLPSAPSGGFGASPAMPSAGGFPSFSTSDFSAAATNPAAGAAPAVPADIPDMFGGTGGMGEGPRPTRSEPETSQFRTWSSDPQRARRAPRDMEESDPTRAGFTDITSIFPSATGSSAASSAPPGEWEEIREAPDAGALSPSAGRTASAMPDNPVVPRTPSFSGPSPAADLGGIALPLPPMDDGGFDAPSSGSDFMMESPTAMETPSVYGAAASPVAIPVAPPAAASGSLRPPPSWSVSPAPAPAPAPVQSGDLYQAPGPGDVWDGDFDPGVFQGVDDPAAEWVEVVPQNLQPAPAAPAAVEPSPLAPASPFTGVDDGPQFFIDPYEGYAPTADAEPASSLTFPPAPVQGEAEPEPFQPFAMPPPPAESGPASTLDAMPASSGPVDPWEGVSDSVPAEPTLSTPEPEPPATAAFEVAMPESEAPTETGGNGSAESGLIFVEPEPGQVIVGQPILQPGAAASVPTDEAPPAAPAAPAPSAPTPLPDFEESPAVVPPTVTPPSVPAPSADAASPSPSPSTSPFQTGDGLVVTVPPGSASTAPSFTMPESFTDPAADLPPVRPEGTVLPTRGGEMPPLLGEGMFGKENTRRSGR